MLKAGFAQVNVNIDETGRHDAAGGVENLRTSGIEICAHLADDSILNGDIGYLVEIHNRVNHAAIFNKKSAHWASTPSKTAMRTAMPFST